MKLTFVLSILFAAAAAFAQSAAAPTAPAVPLELQKKLWRAQSDSNKAQLDLAQLEQKHAALAEAVKATSEAMKQVADEWATVCGKDFQRGQDAKGDAACVVPTPAPTEKQR